MSLLTFCNRALRSFCFDIQTNTPRKKPFQSSNHARKFEQLEDRLLMTVSLDSNGWTDVDASADTRTIYVSSSTGHDGNNGLTPQTAKRTIAAGYALMRDDYPDHLLLKSDDTFNESIPFISGETLDPLGGRSADEPWLVGSYGTGARPLIDSGNNVSAIMVKMECIAFVGLHFEPTRTPGITAAAIKFVQTNGNGGDVLIEDCYFDATGGISFDGNDTSNIHDITVRRNVVVNTYSDSGSHSQGLFVDDVNGLLVEENFFDHNGWKPGTDGETEDTAGGPTIFNHNMYITHHVLDATIQNNILSRGSSMGLKFQPVAGTHYISNNLFVRNGYGLQVGGGVPQNFPPITGATIYANNNVIIEGEEHTALSNGLGVTVTNVNGGSFSGNIIANKIDDSTQFALSIQDGIGWETKGYGVRNFTVEDNTVYNWRGSVQVLTPTQGTPLPVIQNVDFINNTVQEPRAGYGGPLVSVFASNSDVNSFTGGKYYSAGAVSQPFRIGGTATNLSAWKTATGETNATQQPVAFFDPTRSSIAYAASLGLTTYDALIAEISQQSRENWRIDLTADAVNDFIRAGFEIDSDGITPLPEPSISAPAGQSIQPDSAPEVEAPALQETPQTGGVFLTLPFAIQFLEQRTIILARFSTARGFDQLPTSSFSHSSSAQVDDLLVQRHALDANNDEDRFEGMSENSNFDAEDWKAVTDHVFGELDLPFASGLRRGIIAEVG